MIENLITGFIGWYIIIAVCYVIYKLLKQQKMEKTSFAKIVYWALGISLLALLPTLSSCQSTTKSKEYILSQKEEGSIRDILKFSMSMDTVAKEMHTEFWNIINKNGGNPDNIVGIGSKEHLIHFINTTGTYYQRAFYKDALVSLKTGKSYTSEERKILEKTIDKDRVSKNVQLMEKIATQTPIPYNGTEIVFDQDIINGVLENLDLAMDIFKHNINILYNKTYYK